MKKMTIKEENRNNIIKGVNQNNPFSFYLNPVF